MTQLRQKMLEELVTSDHALPTSRENSRPAVPVRQSEPRALADSATHSGWPSLAASGTALRLAA